MTAAPAKRSLVEQAAEAVRTPVCRIGALMEGEGLLLDGVLPAELGYQHR